MSSQTAQLFRLSESDYIVADPAEDVRGRTVVDRDGEEVGHVDDLLVDDKERKVRFLRVGAGGFLGIGEKTFLVPVDAITSIDDEVVRVDETRERMSGAPAYDPELACADEHFTDVYGYWGYPPFWGGGYVYPPYPYRR